MQVLRELGFSEERLQSSVIEVWNKMDLLAGEELAEGGGEGPAEQESGLQGSLGAHPRGSSSCSTPIRRWRRRRAPAAAVAADRAAAQPPAVPKPPLDAYEAAELVWEAVLSGSGAAGGGAGGKLPAAVLTSVTAGAGLPQLLLQMEQKVGWGFLFCDSCSLSIGFGLV
jgi:hypothetical protein